ncbi:unnamed protein product [Spirodela intermedia]|uniref:Dof zinc finger protein n=1 Tax=Spirodela intermedia TaxID=51605 RepID=A0A7I8IW30_SPIIN|nr:unnamed protein product [Spirodela intermedia]CAA6661208.1 unnamed protein product [Spirodela intermedia]
MNIHMDTAEWLKHRSGRRLHGLLFVPVGEIISCTRPPQAMERRLRPQHEQPLKCPRCDSTHTNFDDPVWDYRYFCKTCRRYWTKGGSLRNVPIGGKKPAVEIPQAPPAPPLNPLPSYPGLQLPHLGSLAGNAHGLALMECMLEGHGAVDGGEFGAVMGSFGDMNHGFLSSTFHGGSPPGFSMDGGHSGVFMEAYQSMAINPVETKPHEKLLSLEWQQDQGCADVGRDGFCYPAGVGLWGGMMNSHGSSASNPLV